MSYQSFESKACVIAMLILWLPLALWESYVGTVLWAWFIVPTFGLPPLTLAAAIGISLVYGVLFGLKDPRVKDERLPIDRLAALLGVHGLGPLTLLCIGAVARNWMPA